MPRAFTLRRSSLVLALAWASGPLIAATPSTPATTTGDAQDTRHQDPKTLDTVTVTASPLRGGTEDLAKPVEVLAGERLDDVRGATLGETVSSLPGVQSSNFGPGVGRPIIRGLDGARVGILSGGLMTQDVSTVSQDHAPAIESFLADQIEVLKGPATLLYGSGAIGGVVNVVDGRIPESAPDGGASGRAQMRYDSVNQGVTQMARVDVGSEAFVAHVDGVFRDSDDYRTPGGTQANSFLKTQTGAVGGSLLGDWGFVGVSGARFHNQYGNPGEPGDASTGEDGVRLEMEQDRYELKGSVHSPVLSDSGTLRFSAANTDYQHIEFEGEAIGTRFLKNATEGRIEYAMTDVASWNLGVGLQASTSEFEAIGEEAFVPQVRTRGRGVFAVANRKFGDRFQLDLGARIDDVASDPANAIERDFSPLSASLGGIWKFGPGFELTANLDHAERAPAEEELFANGPHIATAAFEIGNPLLTEEAANQAELGLHFHGDRVEANVSAYYNRFDDFIFLADSGTFSEAEGEEDALPVRSWSQADARFRGVEGEVTFKFTDAWNLRLFGDTVRATFVDNGGNLPRIAPSRAGATLSWRQDGWRASLGAIRYARQDDVAVNESATGGYTLVDAHLVYHWDAGDSGWELFLDGSNLGDDTARVHTSFLKDKVVLPGRGFSTGLRVFF